MLELAWRDLKGNLMHREPLVFRRSSVLRVAPDSSFIGSVEIEARSQADLRVPYAAIMGAYRAANSSCLVHAYSRTLNHEELTNEIETSTETCWSHLQHPGVTPVALAHSGPGVRFVGNASVEARDQRGGRGAASGSQVLDAYTTVDLSELAARSCRSLVESRWCELSATVQTRNAFSRLLCGNFAAASGELQLTHSYFDLQNSTDPGGSFSLLPIPPIASEFDSTVVFYDTAALAFAPYEIEDYGRSRRWTLEAGHHAEIPVAEIAGGGLRVTSHSGTIPTRMSVGLRISKLGQVVPSELVIGAICAEQAPKRYHWAPIERALNARIDFVAYPEIFGPLDGNSRIDLELHHENSFDVRRTSLALAKLRRLLPGTIEQLFGQMEPSDLSYLVVKTDYPGFQFFVSSETNKAISLEHFF